jgi:hypothetical protein
MNKYVKIIKKDAKTGKILEVSPETLYEEGTEEYNRLMTIPCPDIVIAGFLIQREIRDAAI